MITPNANIAEIYANQGVVYLPRALSQQTMETALAAYDWSLAHPGPGASEIPSKGTGTFYQDLANPASFAAYSELLECGEISDIISSLWQKSDVWFMYEQVFKKSGGDTRRTPWHQDSSYLPVRGEQLAVMWITFDGAAKEDSLEFVVGSHHATLFDGSRFDTEDDTAPLYGDGVLPRLPDIEAHREDWEIVSWHTEPGDVILFHPSVLHGGAATDHEAQRRTLSLRFFGEDAVVANRSDRVSIEQDPHASDNVHPLTRMRLMPDGSKFRDAAFPLVKAAS